MVIKMIDLEESFKYPPHFISNHVKIKHPLYGNGDFNLHDFQENLVNHINVNRFSIILSARQMGITQTLLATALWHLNYRPNINIVICGRDMRASKEMLKIITDMHTSLPLNLKNSVRMTTRQNLTLSNGSSVMACDPDTLHTFKGYSISLMIIDGFSHINRQASILNNAIPMLTASSGKLVLASSVVQRHSIFHNTWNDAINNRGSFSPMEFVWQDHPLKDSAWKAQTIARCGRTTFEIEYENKFY